jgi:ABC-2 type transport system permease protein
MNPNRAQFYEFMQINLLNDQPQQNAYRAAGGTHMILSTPDGNRTIPECGPPLEVVIPLMISMAFIGLTLFSSGYLLDAMVQERSNRVIEVLATSVSTTQMVAGKIVGIIASTSCS